MTNKGRVAEALYAEGKTLKEVGAGLGVTHERARQILIARGIKLRATGPKGGLKYKPSFGKLTTRERFMALISPSGSHWVWTGKSFGGYGRFRMKGKTYYAHQAAFILTRGRQPLRMTKQCKCVGCVRPEHWTEGK